MKKISIRLSEVEKALLSKFIVGQILVLNDALIEPTEIVKDIVLTELTNNTNEYPITFHANKKDLNWCLSTLSLDRDKLNKRNSLGIQLWITDDDYAKLKNYQQWHIVNTEETYVKLPTLVRRILIRYVADFFKKFGGNILSEDKRIQKIKEISTL